MKLWIKGSGYNPDEKYHYNFSMYKSTTVGTVYTKLEQMEQDREKKVCIKGNDKLFPMTIRSIGKNIVVIQRIRGKENE